MSDGSVLDTAIRATNAKEVSRSYPRERILFLGILLASLFLFPLLQSVVGGMNYWLHMLLFTFMYIAMASSWNMIGGYAGYTSLGHNVFLAIGAYAAGVIFVYFDVSPFITAPFAGLLAMVFGLLFGFISLRTRGPAFIISTIAMVLVVKIGFDNWRYIGGSAGLSVPFIKLPLEWIKVPFYYGMLLIAIAAVFTSYRLRHSKFGLGLRAVSQDEVKAEAAGINTSQYKILAFGISGLFVGMAGALWGYYLTYLRPVIFLTILVAAQMVLMTILGGKGTVAGPVVGAIIFVAVNEFFVAQLGSSELNIVATGVLLLIVLIFFPEGIIGTLRERRFLPWFLDWD